MLYSLKFYDIFCFTVNIRNVSLWYCFCRNRLRLTGFLQRNCQIGIWLVGIGWVIINFFLADSDQLLRPACIYNTFIRIWPIRGKTIANFAFPLLFFFFFSPTLKDLTIRERREPCWTLKKGRGFLLLIWVSCHGKYKEIRVKKKIKTSVLTIKWTLINSYLPIFVFVRNYFFFFPRSRLLSFLVYLVVIITEYSNIQSSFISINFNPVSLDIVSYFSVSKQMESRLKHTVLGLQVFSSFSRK